MKINPNSFLEPQHPTHQPERPARHEYEPEVVSLYDESEISESPVVYGPGVHDTDGNSIAGQQVPYERIEDE
jgi:hypothetical protein